MAKTPKQKTMAENHKVGTVLATGLFLIICLLIAFPLVCGLLGSFRDGAKVITTGMSLDLHSPVSMQNYSELFAIFHPKGMSADVLETSRKYFMWYKNSLVLTLTTVVLTLLVCYFVAYGLSMYKFKLQGFLFFMVIATMSVPFEILMLPLYQEITKIGLVDSNAGVFLPGLCSRYDFLLQAVYDEPSEGAVGCGPRGWLYRVWYQCQDHDADHEASICFSGDHVCDGLLEQHALADARIP